MAKTQHSMSVEELVRASLCSSLAPMAKDLSLIDYVNKDLDPGLYGSLDRFKRDYAYFSFLRKWKGFCLPELNPSSAALQAWLKAEQQCFQTNRRLYLESSTGSYSVAPSVISTAQRKIAQVLGPLRFDKIAELCRFGNGATYDLRRGSTHADKTCRPSITFEAIPWLCRAVTGDHYLGSLIGGFNDLKVVRSNRMVMVPKTAKTHRSIAAEPTLNSYVQQGVGRYLRCRLKRFGVDLDDQTINRDLASIAQRWNLSTIDLSSASDTLCTNLVKLLLPDDWFKMLDDLRCKSTEYGSRTFVTSKFSSMGNAFTFELESLVFWALCSATCTVGVSSVYGDDIVVHDDDYLSVVEVLRWAGFIVNNSKSFTAGSRFRESCGGHYFDGTDVTPCYQKDVCTRPHDFVRLHNRLVRAGIRLDLRDEFAAAASIVRQRCRSQFGRFCPGVGPLVEYDEYFIREDYVWENDRIDRVPIISAITLPSLKLHSGDVEHIAYYGRKLRSPSFLNPDPKGQCSDVLGPKLLISKKYHWRSASQR